MGLFAIMLGREVDVDPAMVARLSDPGSWEATDRRRDYALSGQGQLPGYAPAPGYPPIQYAQQQYQPQIYDQAHFAQESASHGAPAMVRVPINGKNQFFATAAIGSSRHGLIMFPALIDTGAGASYITHDVAQRMGIRLSRLTYNNEMASVTGGDKFAGLIAPDLCVVEDPKMRSGGYVYANDVRIGVLRRNTLAYSILGMSFLKNLHVSFSGNQMVLSQ